jgi:WD40 repeat protein
MKHDHPVWSVAWNHDGTRVLTGCGDDSKPIGSVQLWDATTGQPIRAAIPQPDEVSQVAFSPDGATFLAVCAVRVELWHTADGRSVAGPLPHPLPSAHDKRVSPALVATYSPDGSRVLTGGEDGTAHFWDAKTGRPLDPAPLEVGGPVLAATFSPDGKTILTGSFSGTAQLWDAGTGARRGPALAHRGPVKAVGFSPDSRVAVTGAATVERDPSSGRVRVLAGEARLWQAETGWHLGPPIAHRMPVWALAFSPDGRLLMTGCEDGRARLFSTATGAPVGRPLEGSGTVTAVSFDRTGTAAVMTGAGGDGQSIARVWNVHAGDSVGRLLLQSGDIRVIAFDPTSRLLASGDEDRRARVWEVPSAKPEGFIGASRLVGPEMIHPGPVSALAFGPDGRTLLTGTEERAGGGSIGTVLVWDRHTGAVRHTFPVPGAVNDTAFGSNGRLALASCAMWGGRVYAWDPDTGTPAVEPLTDLGIALCARVGSGARTLLVGTNGWAGLWDRDARRWLHRWSESRGWTTDAAFHPDGRRVLLVTDGFAQECDLASGRTLGVPPFHPDGGIRHLVYTPDGSGVLVVRMDGTVRLWDATTGRQLGPPLGRDGANAIAVSPNGRFLAAAGIDGRIAVWEPAVLLAGDPDPIRVEIERLTGLALDAQDTIRPTAARDR